MKRNHFSNDQSGEDLLRRFEEFYRLHFVALSRYVSRRLPASSHDEVVAAAFVIAWKKFASVETPSLPWLYRIASFEIAHERRRLGRVPESVELSDLNVSDKYDLEDVMDISSAFTKLSENDQEVLRLLYWEDLTRPEISEVLGCSVNALNVRIHRALERLRTTLRRPELIRDSTDNFNTPFKEDS